MSKERFLGVRSMSQRLKHSLNSWLPLFCLCLLTLACAGRPAAGQAPVASGSVIPLTHAAWNQIVKVQIAHNGSVVLLDWANSACTSCLRVPGALERSPPALRLKHRGPTGTRA